MLKPTRKLVAGGLLALTFVVVSLLAGGVSTWTPAALAQGTSRRHRAIMTGAATTRETTIRTPTTIRRIIPMGAARRTTPKVTCRTACPAVPAASLPTRTSPEPGRTGRVSSPEQPLAYTDQWMTIQPGEWQWFAFKYSYDREPQQRRRQEQRPGAGQSPSRRRASPTAYRCSSSTRTRSRPGRAAARSSRVLARPPPRPTRCRTRRGSTASATTIPMIPACTGGDRSQSACENISRGGPKPRTVQVPDHGIARLLQLEGHHRRQRHLLHRRPRRPTRHRPHPLQIHLHR